MYANFHFSKSSGSLALIMSFSAGTINKTTPNTQEAPIVSNTRFAVKNYLIVLFKQGLTSKLAIYV